MANIKIRDITGTDRTYNTTKVAFRDADNEGEMVTFTEGEGTNVISLSVTENGTYEAPSGVAYSPVTVNVSGGGGSGNSDPDVRFIDYDGSVVYECSAEDLLQMSELPEVPIHEGFISQGWNFTLAEAKEWVGTYGMLFIGHSMLYEPGYGGDSQDDVVFFDYDGTVLHQYTRTEFLALSAMPANPTHTGLTSLGWTYSLEGAQDYVRKNYKLDIGQKYITDDGAVRVYITIPDIKYTYIATYFTVSGGGSITIDWGDGSATETVSSVPSGGVKHTYPDAGSYCIKYTMNNNAIMLVQTANSSIGLDMQTCCLIFRPDLDTTYKQIEYCTFIQKIEANNYLYLAQSALAKCSNLKSYAGPLYMTGNGQFAETGLKYITLQERNGSLALGQYTFKYSSIERVAFPEIQGNIGINYFSYCYGLKRICLPVNASIGQYALSTNNALKTLIIPEGITSLGNYAFQGNMGLEKVIIPSTISTITNQCFNGCTILKKVIFKRGLTTINNSAFLDTNIDYFLLPDTLTTLQTYSLASRSTIGVIFPRSITTTENYLLSSSSSAYKLPIRFIICPKLIQTITGYSFQLYGSSSSYYGMHSLDYYQTPETNSNVTLSSHGVDYGAYIVSGCKMGLSGANYRTKRIAIRVSSYSGNAAYAMLKAKIIASGNVNTSFQNQRGLVDAEIVNPSQTILNNESFRYCYSLKKVKIPNSITTFGNYVFSDCYSLENIDLPSSLVTINSGCFFECYALKEIVIPASVKTIGQDFCSKCSSLKKVSIEEGSQLESIANYGFQYCYSLEEAYLISNSLTTVGNGIFMSCYNLKKASVSGLGSLMFSACYALEEVTLSNTITNFPTSVFSNCYSLKTINYDFSNLTSLGTSAFSSCISYITGDITLPSTIERIGGTCFYNCYTLTSIVLPVGATYASIISLFGNCYMLREVYNFETGTVQTNGSAFSYCYSLEHVSLPSSLTSIAGSMFQYCFALREITIPDSVTKIESLAFASCKSLASIEIPSLVTEIQASAFSACNNLTSIKFKPTTPPTVANSNAWSGIPTSCIIYVPSGTLSTYTSTTNYPNPYTYTYVEY